MTLRWLTLCVFIFGVLPSPVFAASQGANPALAGWYNLLFPGAGYFYNGNTRDGWLSASLALPMTARYFDTWRSPSGGWRVSLDGRSTANYSYQMLDFMAIEVYGFTTFDAYQDALDLAGRPPQLIEIPHYSAKDLFLSPFEGGSYRHWSVLPAVALSSAGFFYHLFSRGLAKQTPSNLLFAVPAILAGSLLVGWGEEAEYRGFEFPAFSEMTHSIGWGVALSSLSFGASHLPLEIKSPFSLRWPARWLGDAGSRPGGISGDIGISGTDVLHASWTALFGCYASYLVANDPNGLKSAITVHAIADAFWFLGTYLAYGPDRIGVSVSFPLPL